MADTLGKLKKINPRTYWKDEARDFTPWLAQENNIALLNEAIGMDLEIIRPEERVGGFSADILCIDRFSDHYVVIENQLAKTDHSHLGQVITYCSGLDARSFIWIATEFREEYRAALDWLNKITDDTFNFFGIEIELYQIGDSLPAPKFNIVSKPNGWSKAVRSQADNASLTPTTKLQLEYWTAFSEYIRGQKGCPLRHQKPSPNHWTNFTIGKTGFYLSATVNSIENQIAVWLIIETANAKEAFDALSEKYEEQSKQAIDPNIKWNRLSDKKQSQIILTLPADFRERNNWSRQFAWLYDNLVKFHNFFKPKIMVIK